MAARLIHFGLDNCHRLMVLQSAGYSVDDCASLDQLCTSLAAGTGAEAVLMSDNDEPAPEDVVTVARKHSSAPVILFLSSNRTREDSAFDLVVPNLTPPEIWLRDVNALIAKSRVRGVHNGSLRVASVPLRRNPPLWR
jgi:hypothetical protein